MNVDGTLDGVFGQATVSEADSWTVDKDDDDDVAFRPLCALLLNNARPPSGLTDTASTKGLII